MVRELGSRTNKGKLSWHCRATVPTLQVTDVIAIRALAVHAKDEQAAEFYRHFDFMPSPTDAPHLFMLIKDIRLAAGRKL